MSEDIQPYVLYRRAGEQSECALWQLKEGPTALALFLSGDSALAYQECSRLGADWQLFRPTKEALGQLLKTYCQAGVGYAVLDPDLEKAKRIFDLQEIIKTLETSTHEPRT